MFQSPKPRCGHLIFANANEGVRGRKDGRVWSCSRTKQEGLSGTKIHLFIDLRLNIEILVPHIRILAPISEDRVISKGVRVSPGPPALRPSLVLKELKAIPAVRKISKYISLCVVHMYLNFGAINWNFCQNLQKPLFSGLSRSTYPFSQDPKGRQVELCPPRILPEAGAEGQHQPWERTEACMGVRLLRRAMLGQTVMAAIIYRFLRTD